MVKNSDNHKPLSCDRKIVYGDERKCLHSIIMPQQKYRPLLSFSIVIDLKTGINHNI